MNQRSPTENPRVMIKLMPDPNPWEDPAALPRLRLPSLTLLCLIVTALCVHMAAPSPSTLYTAAMLALCIGAHLIYIRSIGAALLCVAVYAIGTLAGSIAGGVFALCLVMSLSLGAYLITTVRSPWLLVLPIAAYLISFALFGSPTNALLALITTPSAGLLAYVTMKNAGRVGAVCATSFMLGLCVIFLFVLDRYLSGAALSVETLTEQVELLRTQIFDAVQQSESYRLLLDQMAAYQLEMPMEPDELLRLTIEMMFNVLPALAVLLFNFVSFVAQAICIHTYVGTGMPALATRTSRLFVMSVPSALLFLTCSIVTIFTGGTTLATAAMQNLALILLPPMCIVGFFKTVADLRRQASPLFIIIIIALAIFMPWGLFLCLAVSGALATLMRPIVTRMLLGNKDNHGST